MHVRLREGDSSSSCHELVKPRNGGGGQILEKNPSKLDWNSASANGARELLWKPTGNYNLIAKSFAFAVDLRNDTVVSDLAINCMYILFLALNANVGNTPGHTSKRFRQNTYNANRGRGKCFKRE